VADKRQYIVKLVKKTRIFVKNFAEAGRGRRTEDGERKTEDGGQKTEEGEQKKNFERRTSNVQRPNRMVTTDCVLRFSHNLVANKPSVTIMSDILCQRLGFRRRQPIELGFSGTKRQENAQ